MHQECREWLLATTEKYREFWQSPAILEIGSLNINGSAREFFQSISRAYIGVDLRAGPGVDLRTDILKVPPIVKFDLIVSTEVLEHTPWPREVVAKCAELMSDGGWLVLTCASDRRKPHNAYGAEHPEDGEYYEGIREIDLYQYAVDAGLNVVELSHLTWPGDLRLVARKGV